MSNKVIGDYTAAGSIDGSTNYLLIQPGNSSTAYNKINRNTFFGVTGQPMDISSSQSVTNKTLDNTNSLTLKDTLFTLQDDGDTSKQAKFQLSGLTTATTRTYTLPDRSSTIATLAGTQAFTGANSFTGSSWSGGSIDNATVTVDSISGHTSANTGTIFGLSVSSAKIGTNGVVTSSITDGAVTPAKLVAGLGSSWVGQSWVPTWTNLTAGNGVNASTFMQIGKLVIVDLSFTLGSTSSVGSGVMSVSYPVPPKSTITQYTDLGQATMVGGTTRARAFIRFNTTSIADILLLNVSGSYIIELATSATVPGNWAAGNVILGTFIYEAA